MRRSLLVLGSAFALAVAASPVSAQFKVGIHGAALTGLQTVITAGTTATIADANATYGLGARLMLDPPLFPVAVVGSATYYFPEGDGSYYEGTLAGQLRLPLPIVKPYVTGGYQVKKASGGDSDTGFMAGIGLQLDFMMSFFLEGTFEFNEDVTVGTAALDTTPLVIKGGIMFGGG
jgi:hypothetical protein